MNDPAGVSYEFEVDVTRDVEYGVARIDYQEGAEPMQERPLALDVYRPIDASGPLPALVLAFGGAFHRGTKENDVRPEDGPKNTSIADYWRRPSRAFSTAIFAAERHHFAIVRPCWPPARAPERSK